MVMPPNSNSPNSRPPEDKDEWIAILVALSVLGGAAGWIIFGGFPSLRLGNLNADLLNTETDTAPLTAPSETDAVAVAETETSSRQEDDADAQADPPREVITDQTAATDAENSPFADEDQADLGNDADTREPLSGTSPASPEPNDNLVTVPEPKIPEDTTTETLPVVREPLTFSDLADDYWAKPYIDALTARGILNGFPDGSYAPDRSMTRAELAVQVAQAFDVENQAPPQTFTDIPADYWAETTISEAVTAGFMKGYPDQTFNPDQTVPRVQVLVALATGLSLASTTTNEAALQNYQDQAEIPEWARSKVASALESGLIDVSDDGTTQFRPNAPATRAEVAAMLYNALTYLGAVDPIEEPIAPQ
ncbi:MAG: S-layer homology domain-containing protein [Leptolyngbya sp. SIO1D8]|nr:S-layer homology domain-containing protein [Leptolyngbya sp. SIO1D8]